MASSGMLRRVPLVRTDVSEERSASTIRVTRIGELGTMLVVPCSVSQLLVWANVVPSSLILVTLMMEALCSSEITVLTRATGRNIPEGDILHSHSCENLKSYIATIDCKGSGSWGITFIITKSLNSVHHLVFQKLDLFCPQVSREET
jgi:hypothetical protein